MRRIQINYNKKGIIAHLTPQFQRECQQRQVTAFVVILLLTHQSVWCDVDAAHIALGAIKNSLLRGITANSLRVCHRINVLGMLELR